MAEKKQWRVVGTRSLRPDGMDKVTGQAKYGSDINLPGMLYGRVLRSPHAHARIVSLDMSEAAKMPGVRAVMTAADLPDIASKLQELGESVADLRDESHNIMATGKVLYHGHAVAAVAATSLHLAEEALKAIKVEYEPLEPVIDVRYAMSDDAPLLDPARKMRGIGDEDGKPSNIAQHFQNKRGDLDKGFAEADYVVEREFYNATIHQGYIEPHNATAQVHPDGRVTVWCSSQGHFGIREEVAEVCKLPVGMVKVVPMEIGGGFGGKTKVYLEPLAVIMSQKTARPVKMWMNRTEVLLATGPNPGSLIKCKMGCKKDGTLTAAAAELYFEAGAFPGSAVGAGAGTIFGPFKLENMQVDGYDIVLNKPKSHAYRAPGAPNAAFASECVVDELAELCGLSPLDFRLKNAVKEGDRRADGPVLPRIGLIETLEAAKNSPHNNTKLAPSSGIKRRGRGVASGFWFNGAGPASVILNVNADGSLTQISGSADIGGNRASLANIVAEVLGIEPTDIRAQIGDTDTVGYTSVTGGSSATHKSGLAAHECATKIKEEIIKRAARIWETDAENVVYDDQSGAITNKADAEKKLTFKEVARQANRTGGPITSEVSVNSGGAGPAFAVHIVDVEVDIETGKVDVLRYTAAQDVGTAIHPDYVEGQLEGGISQGVGWALNEEYFYNKDGLLMNASLLDYRMPTMLDLPKLETIMVEVPNPAHPYGIRGVGEVCVVPPLAAVGNAIYNATGIRLYNTPMNPPSLLSEIMKSGLAELPEASD
ncbi:MAG: xanthine dehydrogenase family protein molybdopterin-binding subunit [Candidatus Poribacteria bacterium]|nr:xanthine dehydrogenase family protein molybdopterin-binding subunit [Candidatus Poribacteria bacterium]